MKQAITFINTSMNDLHPPRPAIELLPDWYINTESYANNMPFPIVGDNSTNATIKKCIPVLDAISLGYIISTDKDIWINRENNFNMYHYKGDPSIAFQAKKQAPRYPASPHPQDIPKFINPWAIKTPKGYSCLFIPPLHRETPISILPGVVDTDTYNNPVNFPFFLKDLLFEGLVPAGTPIAQVIPFKRDDWKHAIEEYEKHKVSIEKQKSKLNSVFYNAYKSIFWSRKTYR